MNYRALLTLSATLLMLAGCGSEKEERTELSDYKQQQLDKAKAVEEEMNKRVDTINKQLEESSQKKDDDTL
ncbi:hypothetical protein [Kangiella taiwanensis]|uniref:Lipoprotein n=1 Tax=Kangiella taiwanensis TaxID=1079179 RepID=A0ABP8I4I3_9GAMM|nr:hypothetical protein [Kangiella taiwanensis]